MIKNTLSDLPVYHLLVLTIPAKVAKKLEAIQYRFLWGENKDKRRYHLVKWEEVKCPIELGDLGLGSLLDLNRTLLGKWIWRYWVRKDSLWKKIIKVKWGGGSGVDISGKTLENRNHGMGFWKSIMQQQNSALDFTKWEIGKGNKIRFWQDKLCGNESLMSRFPLIFVIAQKKEYVCKRGMWGR